MEIENIKQAKSDFTKEIKCNCKRFLLASFVTVISNILGAIMFFYVEECYFKVSEPPQYGKRCLELCEQIMKINQTNLNLTEPETDGDELRNITKRCMDMENCIEVQGNSSPNCHLGDLHFRKWSQFAFSIIFTVGKI